MPYLKFLFPGGRYHATPWGSHVNEGLIEWPPCPWRLLRAFIATGYSKLQWTRVPDDARALIESLATVLPTYSSPAISGAHSRHYYESQEGKKTRKDLALDAWANVCPHEPLVVHWDCPLSDASRDMLKMLVENLSYLGRSESWVVGSLIPDEEGKSFMSRKDRFIVSSHADDKNAGIEYEQIRLGAPQSPEAYTKWRQDAIAIAAHHVERRTGPEAYTKWRQDAITSVKKSEHKNYPTDLLACLQNDTAWWKKARWNQPPGFRRVAYWRPSAIMRFAVPIEPLGKGAKRVSSALLALTTPTGNKAGLPHVKWTITEGEKLHTKLASRIKKTDGKKDPAPAAELLGCDEQGKPLRNGHRHLHIFSLDLDGDQKIDHYFLYAKEKLGPQSQWMIRKMRRQWRHKAPEDVQLALAALGNRDDLLRLPDPLNKGIRSMLGQEKGSRNWISITPFVPPRFIKKNGKNTLEGQVAAELESRGLPKAKIVFLPRDHNDKNGIERLRKLRHYKRTRKKSSPPQDVSLALELHFEQPVKGPIALGYGCHFGLGLFEALP